jgi:hypothetical protein
VDDINVAPAPPAEETQVDPGRAEPGRDVFAGKDKGEKEKAEDAARSMEVEAARRVEELEREESAEKEVVEVRGGGAPVAVGESVSAKAVEEKSLSAADAGVVVPPPAETSAALTSSLAGEMAEKKEAEKVVEGEPERYREPAGPKDEAEAEADEAREDLFPGEVKA